MQENSEVQLVRPSLFLWYTSILIFVFVLVGVIWLYASQAYINGTLESTKDKIAQIDHDTQGASLDKKILIAQIINSNTIRPSLDLKNIVAEFRLAAAKSSVGLQGFFIKDDTISTTLISTFGDSRIHPDPASTIINMMRDYAAHSSYFSLEPITSISWDLTKRTTSIQLKVVPNQPSSTSATWSSNK